MPPVSHRPPPVVCGLWMIEHMHNRSTSSYKGSLQKKNSGNNEFGTKGGGVSDQNHYLKVFNNSEKTLGRGGRKANISFFLSLYNDCLQQNLLPAPPALLP